MVGLIICCACIFTSKNFLTPHSLQEQIFSGATHFHILLPTKRSPSRKAMEWIIHYKACIKLFLTQLLFLYAYMTNDYTCSQWKRSKNKTQTAVWMKMEMWIWFLFSYDCCSLFVLVLFLSTLFFLFQWFGIILIINIESLEAIINTRIRYGYNVCALCLIGRSFGWSVCRLSIYLSIYPSANWGQFIRTKQ